MMGRYTFLAFQINLAISVKRIEHSLLGHVCSILYFLLGFPFSIMNDMPAEIIKAFVERFVRVWIE
jgi:hypothetical protein